MQNKSRNIEECVRHRHKEGYATRAGRQMKPSNRKERPPNQKRNKSQITPSHNTKRRHPPNRKRIHKIRLDLEE